MQPIDFRYTLIIKDKEYVLKHSPEGWEENTIQWARSSVYYGLTRSFSLPLKFVERGAELLRRVFYSEGIEGKAVLKIEMLNRETWSYTYLYQGDIEIGRASCRERV